ncbi:MAG TPA: YegP family protein [Pyrinomonadaceae bacterium]|nr:YegP family protein [Pyrinomonadaceae bacterium]
MAGKFVLKTGKNGKYHFNLKASNGQVILTSEQYESRKAAENGIESVKKNSGSDARYERKKAKNGEPFFVLKAGNGEPIGKSEMYKRASSMENGIKSVMKNAPGATTVDGK